jgi:hypothetical protein
MDMVETKGALLQPLFVSPKLSPPLSLSRILQKIETITIGKKKERVDESPERGQSDQLNLKSRIACAITKTPNTLRSIQGIFVLLKRNT